MVRQFHKMAGYPAAERIVLRIAEAKVILPSQGEFSLQAYLRIRNLWCEEEVREIEEAIGDNDVPAIADGLADLIYFAFGTAVTLGIDLQEVFEEVQKANMKKFIPCFCKGSNPNCPHCRGLGSFGVFRTSDGKLMKPAGWIPPDIMAVILAQSNRGTKLGQET